MRRHAALSSLFVISLAAPSLSAQETFRWNGRVAAGDAVEVIGIAADIEATAATGDRVELTATGLEDGARVEVQEHAGGVTFCVIHAGMHRRSGEGRCSVQGDGMRRHHRHEDVEVHVRIPAGVRLHASTVSGEVTAEGLGGDVEARSVSGDVTVSTRGSVEAASVSGDVVARMGRLPRSGELEFRSVSGSVEVTLPAGADAEVRANTLSGDIESDFPLDLNDGRRSGRRGWQVRVGSRARGTLGDGGVRLEMETVSGDITLRRGR